MLQKLKNLVVEEEGQALTEYGLIIALVAVVLILFLTSLGTTLQEKFQEIITGLGGDEVGGGTVEVPE